MDIIERYISAYVVECLTGVPGGNPGYYSVLAETQSNTEHPLLKQVLALAHGREPRNDDVKMEVRNLAMHYLATKYPGLSR